MERALNGIRVRPASAGDLETVLDILGEAASWTTARGFENWPARFSGNFIGRSISTGQVHVVEIGTRTVATIGLHWDDPMIWGSMPPDGGYVHRLAVRTAEHGNGIGYALLDWSAEQVAADGREWLRLDVTTDNLPLRRYYERAGFSYVRDAHGELTMADGTERPWHTSLYQRRVIPPT